MPNINEYAGPTLHDVYPHAGRDWADKKKYKQKYEDEKYTLPSRRTYTRNVLSEADEVLGIKRKKMETKNAK